MEKQDKNISIKEQTIKNLQTRLNKFGIELNESFENDKKEFLVNNAPDFVSKNYELMPNIVNTTTHPDDVNFLDLGYSNNLTSQFVSKTGSKVLFEVLGVKKLKLAAVNNIGQKIQGLPLNKKFSIENGYFIKIPIECQKFINKNKNQNISEILINLCEEGGLSFRNKIIIAKTIIASVVGLNGDFENEKTKVINSDFIKYIYGQILGLDRLPNRLNIYIVSNIREILGHTARQLMNINLSGLTKGQKEQIIYLTVKNGLIDYVNKCNPEINDIFDNIGLLDDKGKVNMKANFESDNSAFGPASTSNIYKSFTNIINDVEFGVDFIDFMVKSLLIEKQGKPIELGITNDGGIIYILQDLDGYKIIKQGKTGDIYIGNGVDDLKFLLTGLNGSNYANISNLKISQFTNVFDGIHSILGGSIVIGSERGMREKVLYILEGYLDQKGIKSKYISYLKFIKDIKINGDNSLRDGIANIDTDENGLYPSFNNRFSDSLYMCLLGPKVINSVEFTRSYMNAEMPFDLSDQKDKLMRILEVQKINEKAEIC